MNFGHETLDVYQLSLQYVGWVMEQVDLLKGSGSTLRDQWSRASQSIPLNIAEGNGKFSDADRRRFFEIARGSALECSAVQDILEISRMLSPELNISKKAELIRIVSMLTKMGGRGYVNEAQAVYGEVSHG